DQEPEPSADATLPDEAVAASADAALAENDATPEAAVLTDDPEAPLVTLAPPPELAPVFTVLPEAWVLELSSFQLDGVSNFEPSAAAVLNVSQDHLDWHGSMDAYAQAKARIFGKQGVMVINRDDPAVLAMVPTPEVIKSTVRGRPARMVHREVVQFGLDA